LNASSRLGWLSLKRFLSSKRAPQTRKPLLPGELVSTKQQQRFADDHLVSPLGATALSTEKEEHVVLETSGAMSINELIVMPSGKDRGGAEEALLQYVAYRATEGAAPHIITLEPGSLREALETRGSLVTFIDAGRLRNARRWIGTVYQIARIVSREKVRVILSWMSKGHLYGGLASLLTKTPAIYYQMGLPDDGLLDRVCRALPAAGALGCSDFVTQRQQQAVAYPVISAPLAVDINRFEKATSLSTSELKVQLGFDPARPLIGIVGRLQRWKGMHIFAEAMAKTIEVRPDCQAVIVGGPHDLEVDYADWLKKRIQELGLDGKVLLAGKQKNVPEWIQAMDIFVHASELEPFGIVVLEAMLLGKPVIATKPGGPEEIIRHGEHGLLVPSNDAASLAHAILSYLSDPELAARLGSAARKRALYFSPERFARRVLSALEHFAEDL
jgi:glycosyltransferase involved in cell wall biosynthesis